MQKLIKEFGLALALTLLWFGSAYVMAWAFIPVWALPCGLINAGLGTMALFLTTRTERGARLFYEGPSNGGSITIALLWGLPVILFLWGIIGWVLNLLGFWKF